ncbi:MAG: PEGA domain-containing protein [Phycisphaeraceae bacterium]
MPARNVLLTLALFAVVLAGGCVQRTITVTSDPPEALVYLNDVEVGRTPLRVPFTFYGVYDVRLEREGYETLQTATEAEAPWWETPGPDLVAEALPGDQHVNLHWHYDLSPSEPIDPDELLDHARQLRSTFDPRHRDAGEETE